MTRPCDYAACNRVGSQPAGPWWFCRQHLAAHRELEAEEAFHRARNAPAVDGMLLPAGSLTPLLNVLDRDQEAAA